MIYTDFFFTMHSNRCGFLSYNLFNICSLFKKIENFEKWKWKIQKEKKPHILKGIKIIPYCVKKKKEKIIIFSQPPTFKLLYCFFPTFCSMHISYIWDHTIYTFLCLIMFSTSLITQLILLSTCYHWVISCHIGIE